MQVKVTKPFIERALSPLPFYQEEIHNIPDKIAKKLITRGDVEQVTVNKSK